MFNILPILILFSNISYAPFTSNCTDSNPEICGCVGNYYVCENEFKYQYDSDCYHDDLDPECRPFMSPDVPGPDYLSHKVIDHEDDDDQEEGNLGKIRYSNVGISYSCPSHNPPRCKCWVHWDVCLYEFLNVFEESCYHRSLNNECKFTAQFLSKNKKYGKAKGQVSPPNNPNKLQPFSNHNNNKKTNKSSSSIYEFYKPFIILFFSIICIITCSYLSYFIFRKFCQYDLDRNDLYLSSLYDIKLDHNGEILLDENTSEIQEEN